MLVMQATMGIHQSIFQHLRQFSLDRLQVAAAGVFGGRHTMPDPWTRARLSFN